MRQGLSALDDDFSFVGLSQDSSDSFKKAGCGLS